MSKLDEYIKSGEYPIVRTGIGNDDWVLQTWKRKEQNITYTCTLCDCEIKPDDFLLTLTKRDYTVPREGISGIKNVSEVLGFICRKCHDEDSYYFTLSYG